MTIGQQSRGCGIVLAAALCAASPVAAQENEPGKPTQEAAQAAGDQPPPSISDTIPQLAGLAAFKKRLRDAGVTLQSTYIGENLNNIDGGLRQGAAYDGRLELMIEADMEKIANWRGGTLHADGYWIHGTGLTRYFVGNLQDVSYIEALPTVRLYELWYEQKLADSKLALRAGLLGADSDFVSSKYAQLFANATTGWPEPFTSNMPSGGPAYPFSAMGFRAKYALTDAITLVAAIYDGDPAGPGTNDPQRRNAFGANFRLQDSPLLMQEAQYAYNQGKDATGLAGAVKLGAWQHLGGFPDQRFNAAGQAYNLVGYPGPNRSGDYGFYGMIDQLAIKSPDDATKGVGVFARVFGSPGDRNLVDFYFDTGVNVSGFVPGRSDDVFGVSFAFTHISRSVRGAANDAGFAILPDYESLIEATYQASIIPGWTVQPVAQYVIHPGARLGNASLPNALVLGVRSTVSF